MADPSAVASSPNKPHRRPTPAHLKLFIFFVQTTIVVLFPSCSPWPVAIVAYAAATALPSASSSPSMAASHGFVCVLVVTPPMPKTTSPSPSPSPSHCETTIKNPSSPTNPSLPVVQSGTHSSTTTKQKPITTTTKHHQQTDPSTTKQARRPYCPSPQLPDQLLMLLRPSPSTSLSQTDPSSCCYCFIFFSFATVDQLLLPLPVHDDVEPAGKPSQTIIASLVFAVTVSTYFLKSSSSLSPDRFIPI